MAKVKFEFNGFIELSCINDEEVKKAQAKIIRGLFNKLNELFEKDMRFYKKVHCKSDWKYLDKHEK